LLKQKVAQNVTIFMGYFIFSKNHNEPPKVALLSKITQSGHPDFNSDSCHAFQRISLKISFHGATIRHSSLRSVHMCDHHYLILQSSAILKLNFWQEAS
jgi:hypothetical protein